jgi:hypothetical protein
MLIFVIGASAKQAKIEDEIDSLFVMASSLDIKYRDSVGPAREAIAAMGTEAVPHLIEMLGTPHGRERAALEDIFKKIGEKAVPQLNKALLDTDSLRLSRVAKILYFFPDTSSVENLLKAADNDYYSARYQVIRALGVIGDRRAVPAIRNAMKDSVELVRTIAAVSAGRIADPSLLPEFVRAFDDVYYGVRMSAQDALIKFPCDAKWEFIVDYLPTASLRVREQMLKFIAEDTCNYNVNIVRPFVYDEDPLLKSLALRAAYRLDSAFVYDYLSQWQDSTDNFILRWTIDELKRPDETETPTNP